jgi:hypothetical protein
MRSAASGWENPTKHHFQHRNTLTLLVQAGFFFFALGKLCLETSGTEVTGLGN